MPGGETPDEERRRFAAQRRRLAPERMDRLFAPEYDRHWGEIGAVHGTWVDRLLALTPSGGLILDAACGTGIYWPRILAGGHRVLGIDHSGGMLARARSKHPEVETRQLTLQELVTAGELERQFDGLICVDAMENVLPEDWPTVLNGFRRVLKPGAPAYLTVELPTEEVRARLASPPPPLRPGEILWPDDHGGGYHHYPPASQVRTWLTAAGFAVLDLLTEPASYDHILLKAATS